MTREEALQAIKAKMDYYESDKRLRGALETLVPELAESEDERIIKTIRQLLETARDAHSNTSLAKPFIDALAWLEKQKEQKPAKQLGGTFTSYDMAKTFTEGQNYVIAHPEKFGLCKPAEWSEEDEHCIHQLILFCENCMQQDSEAIRCATWLKSLRPQPSWKPSEEQMEALEYVISDYREDGCNATANYLQEILDHLKNM